MDSNYNQLWMRSKWKESSKDSMRGCWKDVCLTLDMGRIWLSMRPTMDGVGYLNQFNRVETQNYAKMSFKIYSRKRLSLQNKFKRLPRVGDGSKFSSTTGSWVIQTKLKNSRVSASQGWRRWMYIEFEWKYNKVQQKLQSKQFEMSKYLDEIQHRQQEIVNL